MLFDNKVFNERCIHYTKHVQLNMKNIYVGMNFWDMCLLDKNENIF